jgi:hypothetical protein
MRRMSEDSFIHCRVDSKLKAAIRRIADDTEVTESALIKQVLKDVARMSGALPPSIGANRRRPRDARLYVRLHPSDRLLLTERAAARAMAPATYVAVMVRAHLNHLAPLPKEELLALRDAVSQLADLRRLLNRMGGAADGGPSVSAIGSPEVAQMGQVCAALHDRVMALLVANAKSWRKGYAETSLQTARGTAPQSGELRQERSDPP